MSRAPIDPPGAEPLHPAVAAIIEMLAEYALDDYEAEIAAEIAAERGNVIAYPVDSSAADGGEKNQDPDFAEGGR